jgi:hypothetical protein
MIRRIRQWLCGRKGHPHDTTTVPRAGDRPQEPDYEETYCTGCGAIVRQAWHDSTGTEYIIIEATKYGDQRG